MAGASLEVVAKRLNAVVLPDNKVWTNRLQIKSGTSTALYVVAQRLTDGMWGCSCRGWIAHRNCKHLKAMLPALEATLPSKPAATPSVEPLPAPSRAPTPAKPRVALPTPAKPGEQEFLAWYDRFKPTNSELERLIALAHRRRT